jgi:hypothetical protein
MGPAVAGWPIMIASHARPLLSLTARNTAQVNTQVNALWCPICLEELEQYDFY